MDPTLKALLDTLERLDATAPANRVGVLEALWEELPRLSNLTKPEWDAKLAHIEDDVFDLGQQAEHAAAHATRVTRLHEQAQRGLETLAGFAARRVDQTNDDFLDHADDGHENAIVEAESTRDAVLLVMDRDPQRRWTPQAVYDQLRRFGRPTSRSNVQTTLQRLSAVGEQVQRVGGGSYRLVTESADDDSSGIEASARTPERILEPTSNGRANGRAPWLTPEILQRVAEEAQARFLAQHPGEADPEQLISEAKRRVVGWTERHHEEPYDEGHVRRLMKTALNDHYRRTQRNGSTRDHDVEPKEVTA